MEEKEKEMRQRVFHRDWQKRKKLGENKWMGGQMGHKGGNATTLQGQKHTIVIPLQ